MCTKIDITKSFDIFEKNSKKDQKNNFKEAILKNHFIGWKK